jgi:two-component sensor histidine kinase
MTELVTNAVKYAYPSGQCKVWVVLSRSAEESATISVRDEGVGLPVDFDAKTDGLGMRLIEQFTKQLRGNLQILRRKPGTEFVLSFPSLV